MSRPSPPSYIAIIDFASRGRSAISIHALHNRLSLLPDPIQLFAFPGPNQLRLANLPPQEPVYPGCESRHLSRGAKYSLDIRALLGIFASAML